MRFGEPVFLVHICSETQKNYLSTHTTKKERCVEHKCKKNKRASENETNKAGHIDHRGTPFETLIHETPKQRLQT